MKNSWSRRSTFFLLQVNDTKVTVTILGCVRLTAFIALYHRRTIRTVRGIVMSRAKRPHPAWFKGSVEMLHKTQNFAPLDPKCWYNVRKMNQDNLTYVFIVVFCDLVAFSVAWNWHPRRGSGAPRLSFEKTYGGFLGFLRNKTNFTPR